MRLLPRNNEEGWTPYAWLIYLASLFVYPLMAESGLAIWVATVSSVVIFLALYFRGYWLSGTPILPIVAAITVLGVLMAPINSGGSVYFVYATAFLGRSGPTGRAIRWLVGIVAVLGIETLVLDLHPTTWVPGVIFGVLIGAINIHYGEIGRKNATLRLAHDEVERLAKIAERERIARDLHDLLGHTLSVVVLKSELASKLADQDPVRAAQEIREVEAICRQALTEVRQAVKGYRTEASGIQQELANASRALELARVAFECEQDDLTLAAELLPRQESAMALALREAVTNVVRHAGASRCWVRLFKDEASYNLEVSDDGCGGLAPEGSGLAGMRERVESLGGRVEREGNPGTRLAVSLPLAIASVDP
ncbi:MAG: sensor histidine kinase [Thermoanaerobaculia bacterium]|nr:sensor histidine kinase [Thermoanaerobaculia bacterium]